MKQVFKQTSGDKTFGIVVKTPLEPPIPHSRVARLASCTCCQWRLPADAHTGRQQWYQAHAPGIADLGWVPSFQLWAGPAQALGGEWTNGCPFYISFCFSIVLSFPLQKNPTFFKILHAVVSTRMEYFERSKTSPSWQAAAVLSLSSGFYFVLANPIKEAFKVIFIFRSTHWFKAPRSTYIRWGERSKES